MCAGDKVEKEKVLEGRGCGQPERETERDWRKDTSEKTRCAGYSKIEREILTSPVTSMEMWTSPYSADSLQTEKMELNLSALTWLAGTANYMFWI